MKELRFWGLYYSKLCMEDYVEMEQRKTALVLGGGGARGAYEIGVWQALRELGISIDIVTGSSVGAINGAMVAQGAFDMSVSLWKELNTSMVFDIDLKDIISNTGVDCSGLKSMVEKYIDEDSIRKSSIDYGLVTVEFPSMTPNYLMKNQIPIGEMTDYILASASCFPAIKSYKIGKSNFIDGCYSDNLPVGLALDNGATHVIAVDLDGIGMTNKKRMADADYLKIIQCNWDLGNYLIFKKENIKRIMRLGYLDTLKSFDVYDGVYYSFVKGDFNKKSVKEADSAGRIFELDPSIIYKKHIFNIHLKDNIDSYQMTIEKEILFSSKTLKGKIIDGFEKIKSTLNQKTVTIIIARSLIEASGEKNIFLSKPAMKLLKDELSAANYIIKEGLIKMP